MADKKPNPFEKKGGGKPMGKGGKKDMKCSDCGGKVSGGKCSKCGKKY